MHGIGGRSMVEHAVAAARPEALSASLLWYVTSAIRLLSMCLRLTLRLAIVDQDEIPSTGRAVEVGLNALDAQAPVSGTVLPGDLRRCSSAALETLRRLIAFHGKTKNSVTVLTTRARRLRSLLSM